jgi:hypothetical protein
VTVIVLLPSFVVPQSRVDVFWSLESGHDGLSFAPVIIIIVLLLLLQLGLLNSSF